MKHKVMTLIFVLSWFAVFCIAGGLDQYIISVGQAVVYFIIIFTAMGISGFLSGMLILPDKHNKK